MAGVGMHDFVPFSGCMFHYSDRIVVACPWAVKTRQENRDREMSEDNDSASGRQVISRAAAVLRALAEDNSGQSLGQIAKKTDLPRTTVHRIVAALEAQQLAATTPAGVRLGQALVRLAASAHTDVVAAARPSSRRWGGGCAKPWTCACSGASTRYRSTSSPRTRNCAWSRRWAPPIRSTAPRMARPCWRAWTTRRWRSCWARGWNAAPPAPSPRARICWRSWPSPDPGLGTGPGGTRGRHLRDRRAYRDRPIRAVRAVGRAAGRALRRAARRLPGGLVPVQGRD